VPSLRRALPLAVVFWTLAAAPVFAQTGWLLTPFLGMKFGGTSAIVDLDVAASSRKTTFGVSASLMRDGIFGVEAEFAYVPGYFEDSRQHNVTSSSVLDLSGNLIAALPPNVTGGGLRPYTVIGIGVIHAEASDVLDIFRIRRSVPAVTLGAGAIGLVTNSLGVRFDIRYLRSLANDSPNVVAIGKEISYWRTSVGIVRRF
jgi:opacity protein-like surface antigen